MSPTDSIQPAAIPSFRILGFKVSALTIENLIEHVERSIEHDEPSIVVSQNMHGLNLYFQDPEVRRLHARALIRVDGTPILWIARLCGVRLGWQNRVAWIDLFWPLIGRATERGWRVFYLGGEEAVLRKGIGMARDAYPSLEIGCRNGFFNAGADHPDNEAVLAEIERFKPDILIVGMGMPRQENWILRNRDRLAVPVVMSSGGCIEVIAGALPTPPRWLGRFGLEWTWRLASTPKRCAWRYLVEPWLTLALLVRYNLRSAATEEPSA